MVLMVMVMVSPARALERAMSENAVESSMILSSTGNPYVSRDAALSAIKQRHLDPELYEPVEVDGGFAIAEKRSEGDGTAGGPSVATAALAEPAEPEYFWVEFSPKTSSAQQETVQLGVNGLVLFAERGKPTIMPTPHLKMAKDSRYPLYKQKPRTGRQVISGYANDVAYSVLRPATKAEFLQLLKAGTDATKLYMETREMEQG